MTTLAIILISAVVAIILIGLLMVAIWFGMKF